MLDPLELELQAVESHPVWALGSKLRSSKRRIQSPLSLLFGLCFCLNRIGSLRQRLPGPLGSSSSAWAVSGSSRYRKESTLKLHAQMGSSN